MTGTQKAVADLAVVQRPGHGMVQVAIFARHKPELKIVHLAGQIALPNFESNREIQADYGYQEAHRIYDEMRHSHRKFFALQLLTLA
jgi:hypothetical protein